MTTVYGPQEATWLDLEDATSAVEKATQTHGPASAEVTAAAAAEQATHVGYQRAQERRAGWAEPHPELYSYQAAINGDYPAIVHDSGCEPCDLARQDEAEAEAEQAEREARPFAAYLEREQAEAAEPEAEL